MRTAPGEDRGRRTSGPSAPPFARFDDLRTGPALAFESHGGQTLVAHHPQEVVPVLRAVEEATAAGSWAAGFVSYEAAAGLGTPLPVRPVAPRDAFAELPLVWFGIFDAPRSVEPLDHRPEAGRACSAEQGCSAGPWTPDWDPADYERKCDTVRGRIAAGDTYQCNLTVRLRSRVVGDLRTLYRDLALAQRGAYNAYLDTGRFVIASASPELFFEWCGDRLTARPMKGTITRGRWPDEDADQADKLARSAKDRAENVMIVDLLRNDLGKLAEWGSVEVPALFDLERFETLWQLTSTVTARPRPGTTLVDVFEALFPCGSVTGAPKRSTMELIARLEESRRGVYCGAVGTVAPPGAGSRARFNVAIRTVVVDRADGSAVYGTGGGITWDSTAAAEHAELLAKSAILGKGVEDFELVETMGYWPGEGLRNVDRHLDRMAGSADYFGFPADDTRIRSALDEAVADASAPRRVRLTLSRSGAVTVKSTSMPPPYRRPVVLAIDLEPVDSSAVWPYHKTTRRSPYELRAARHPDADDVVLVNERGEPTETTIATLCVRLGGRWWTPPLGSGCLPGVERRRLIENGRLSERTLTCDDLYAADGLALVSSARGWRAATLLGGGRERRPVLRAPGAGRRKSTAPRG
jgi:para-aminobenzoate synthetase/4-amino-4-deoxychorismate lyase